MGTIIWKETKYGCTLLTALYQLQQANVMCDLEIKSKNLNIPVHKLVLQAFNGTIYSNQLNKPSNIEDLVAKCGKFDSNTVLALIQYLYTGEVVIEKNEVERFFKLCKDFQLDNVVSSIQEECSRLEKCLNQRRCIPSAPTSAHDSVIDTKVNMPDISVQSADPSRSLEDSLMELNSNLMMVVKEEPVDNFLCEKDTSDNSNGFMEESSPKKSKTELLENEQTQKDGAIKLRMCCICSKIFENEDEYVSHMEAEHELYTCSKCDFQDQKKSNLIMHIAEKHSGNSERPTNDSRVKINEHSFELSGKETIFYEDTAKTVFRCNFPSCNFHTVHPRSLRRHADTIHKSITVQSVSSTNDRQKYYCHQCCRSFFTKCGLIRHEKSKHLLELAYKCAICKKGFMEKRTFKGHMAGHIPDLKLKCNHCSKKYQQKKDLQIHIKTKHTKELHQFACNLCSKTFIQKQFLAQHKKGVHEEKKHNCKFCGREFKWRSSLKYHRMKCNKPNL